MYFYDLFTLTVLEYNWQGKALSTKTLNLQSWFKDTHFTLNYSKVKPLASYFYDVGFSVYQFCVF